MIRKQKEGIQWLEFELLAEIPYLVHGVFLRHGGVSEGPYESLHAGGGGKGDPQAIQENQARIKKIMNIDYLVSAHQVHGTNVVEVDYSLDEAPHCDGLMTKYADLALMIRHADCQVAIFFDPIRKVIANIHCGWKGNVKNIYRTTILHMQSKFASLPENILVGISPSLGPQKAEFIHFRQEFPESFWPYQIKPNYFDLWAIARMQLEEEGVLPHHIEIASLCTYSNPHDFFSYRRDNKVKGNGNHATCVAIRVFPQR